MNIGLSQDARSVRLIVTDDGVGFDVNARRSTTAAAAWGWLACVNA